MLRNGWKFAIVAAILAFPFTANHAAVYPDSDLRMGPEQRMAQTAAQAAKKVARPETRFFFAFNYMSVVLDIDHFDPKKRIELCDTHLHELSKGDIVIHDNWAAANCAQVPIDMLNDHPYLKYLEVFSVVDHNGRDLSLTVFVHD